MFPPNFSREQMIEHLSSMPSDDYGRFRYCLNMGFTYISVALLEDRIVDLMTMCDAVRVRSVLKSDAKAWQLLLEKRDRLEQSTLGSLVKILACHISERDVKYLTFLKRKRDHFVHRFFRGGNWPGNLDSLGCELATRQLIAMDIIFRRGTDRIVNVFIANGLLLGERMMRKGEDGILLMNPNFPEFLFD